MRILLALTLTTCVSKDQTFLIFHPNFRKKYYIQNIWIIHLKVHFCRTSWLVQCSREGYYLNWINVIDDSWENWFRKQSTCKKYYFAYSEWDIASFEESPMKTAGLITILTDFLYGKNFRYTFNYSNLHFSSIIVVTFYTLFYEESE